MCENEYHSKCAGISGLIVDALRDSSKGLRWACEKCHPSTCDFFQLFKQSRAAFLEMSKDLASVQSKLAKYDNSFKTFSVLNNLENSPPRKKALRSNSKNKKNELAVPILSDNDDIVVVEEMDTLAPPNVPTSITVTAPTLPPPISTNFDIPRQLMAVAPKKCIFISRLTSDTSEDDVLTYLKAKIGTVTDVEIKKFKFANPRTTSSFKIFVPDGLFDTLLNNSIWPKYTIVKKFEFRGKKGNNNLASLPKNL